MSLIKTYLLARLKLSKVFFLSAMFGVVTQCCFAFFRILIIDAFILQNSGSGLMFQSKSIVTYIWLTQAFLAISPWNINGEDMNLIKSGNIVYELARPIDLHLLMFAKTWTQRFVNTLVRAIPILIVNLLLLPLVGLCYYSITTDSVLTLLLFVLSLFMSFILSSCITVCIYSITLYTINASNFIGISGTIAMLLSGNVLPLTLFPDFMQTALTYQPLKGIIDTPAMILSGQYTMNESLFFIVLQLVWIVIFFIINLMLFSKAEGKIILQGG